MAFVAALALISSQNSAINGLASICQGMAKMNMMPRCFKKLNKNNVPYVGVWFISILILVFAFISSDSSDAISFFILVGSVFWMVSYILHILMCWYSDTVFRKHQEVLRFHLDRCCR